VLALAEDTPASPEGYHHVEVISPGGIELSFNNIGLAQKYDAGCRRPDGGGRVKLGFSLARDDGVDVHYHELATRRLALWVRESGRHAEIQSTTRSRWLEETPPR
jgi:hypothetical protein